MATLSAKKIQDALKKAQRVGQVEEPLTINDCEVVLSSLTPDEFEEIDRETTEVPEGIGYVNAFKREHLARSIVEINGADLRGVTLVEVEVEEIDPKTQQPFTKEMKVERHIFVRDFVIRSWSRESIDVAFRKFNEVVDKAEKVAAAKVTFETPDETAEEKYRRLLSEAKELEGGISMDNAAKIREDLGFTTSPSQEEYKTADSRLGNLVREPDEYQPAPEAQPNPPPAPVRAHTPLVRPAAAPVPGPRPIPDGPTPEALMAARQPLNARAIQLPTPTQSVPPEVQPVSPPPQGQPPLSPASLRKSAEIAAMEGDFGTPEPAIQGGSVYGVTPPGMQPQPGPAAPVQAGTTYGVTPPGQRPQAAEVARQVPRNPQAAEPIFDQPPVAGINPRFRPPTKL